MTQCCGQSRDRHSFHGYKRCERKGELHTDGKYYCHTHNPQNVADRRAARSRARDERYEAERKQRQIALAAPDMLKLISDIARDASGAQRKCQEMLGRLMR